MDSIKRFVTKQIRKMFPRGLSGLLMVETLVQLGKTVKRAEAAEVSAAEAQKRIQGLEETWKANQAEIESLNRDLKESLEREATNRDLRNQMVDRIDGYVIQLSSRDAVVKRLDEQLIEADAENERLMNRVTALMDQVEAPKRKAERLEARVKELFEFAEHQKAWIELLTAGNYPGSAFVIRLMNERDQARKEATRLKQDVEDVATLGNDLRKGLAEKIRKLELDLQDAQENQSLTCEDCREAEAEIARLTKLVARAKEQLLDVGTLGAALRDRIRELEAENAMLENRRRAEAEERAHLARKEAVRRAEEAERTRKHESVPPTITTHPPESVDCKVGTEPISLETKILPLPKIAFVCSKFTPPTDGRPDVCTFCGCYWDVHADNAPHNTPEPPVCICPTFPCFCKASEQSKK